jgi:dienelactone hydrolase
MRSGRWPGCARVPTRIAAIGWSHGGGTAVAVDATALVAPLHLAGGGFRAVAALYPGCRGLQVDALVGPLLLMGEADKWTPPHFCTDLLSSLPPGGPVVITYTYPGATHEFDNVRAHGSRQVNGRIVPLAYSAQDAADAHERVLQFFAAQLR